MSTLDSLQKRYRLLNKWTGWVIFLVSATVYLLTLEPTASFWDCTEYIACSSGLEVGHPPGAPLFLLLGRFFSLLASSPEQVGWWVNAMSGLCSAFTILFLFWSITHLARKFFLRDESQWTEWRMMAVLAAGAVGALAYTFSDSFWFSAVEGEVYAMSSMFTAAVFWAMLRWEDEADEPGSIRWIVLIALLIGLSIGVHLLNLLTIPAMVFIWYFRTYKKITRLNLLLASVAALVLLVAIQNGLIPGLVNVAASSEIFFVNAMKFSFNQGTIIYFVLLAAFLVSGIIYAQGGKKLWFYVLIGTTVLFFTLVVGSTFITERWQMSSLVFRLVTALAALGTIIWQRHNFRLLLTAFLSVSVLIVGYSSFLVLVIRSNAGTPINEGSPKDALSLLAYLNRDQYGDWPLLFGPYYNTPLDTANPYLDGTPVYAPDEKTGRYVITDQRRSFHYNYDSRYCTFFPRMWNSGSDKYYDSWAGTVGHDVEITLGKGRKDTIRMPTFTDNMKYFFNYQVWHMYARYFLWNFVGRQNDIGSYGRNLEGNWMSGIKPLDEMRLGDLDHLPMMYTQNKAQNYFYGIPLILGIIGLIFHVSASRRDALVVMLLFLFTGLSIIIYLNQTPGQPRERDYAYVGSFYAFAIWIGLGVLRIFEWLTELFKKEKHGFIASALLGMIAPALMGAQGWNDHNRSGRTTARDIAINFLESCPKNAILFTYADNDTFPLWYAQEVEGVRTDVRIICLSLFGSEWYVDAVKKQLRHSEPLPVSMKHDQYKQGTRDYMYVYEEWKDTTDLKQVVAFATSDNKSDQYEGSDKEWHNYIPARNFSIRVDRKTVVQNGTIFAHQLPLVPDSIVWRTGKQQFDKGDLAVLDILAHNDWKRPICFTSGMPSSYYYGLGNFLQLEGLVYKLVPFRSDDETVRFPSSPMVNTTAMYQNVMNKFQWGGADKDGIYLDEAAQRFFIDPMRQACRQLAIALYQQGDYTKAAAVAQRCLEKIPFRNYPPDNNTFQLVQVLFLSGAADKAVPFAETVFENYAAIVNYYQQGGADNVGSDGEAVQNMNFLLQMAMATGQEKTAKKFFERMQQLKVPLLKDEEESSSDGSDSVNDSLPDSVSDSVKK